MSSTTFVISLALLASLLHAASSQLYTNDEAQNWKEGEIGSLECHWDGTWDAEGFNWSGPALADLGERVTIHREDTLSRLRINDVAEADAGSYECTHRLASSSVSYNVTVQVVPNFTPNQTTEFNVLQSGDVQLPCQVERCHDNCEVKWRKGNRFFHQENMVTSREGHTLTQSLTLTNVQPSDEGVYWCVVPQLEMPLNFTLTVIPHDLRTPIINKSIENSYKEIHYTHPLVLHCPVRSGENTTANPLVVSWVYPNIHGEQQHSTGQELRIAGGQYVSGEYKCTAANNVGSDSLDIFVQVQAPPLTGNKTLPKVTVSEDRPQVTLVFVHPITPVALHSLSYLWEKLVGGVWMPLPHNGDKYRVSVRGHLTIFNVGLSDAAVYKVTISNEFGSSVQTQQVDVSPRPTVGTPVVISFTFTLPEGSTCSELQGTSEQLTEHLTNYLQSLCSGNECSDLQVMNVSVDCAATIYNAHLRGKRAQTLLDQFQEIGPTDLPGTLMIVPCAEGECVTPTQVIRIEKMVIALIVVVLLLVVAMVTIIFILICLATKRKCSCSHKRCKVADVEALNTNPEQLTHFRVTTPQHTLHIPHDPHIPTDQYEPRYAPAPQRSATAL